MKMTRHRQVDWNVRHPVVFFRRDEGWRIVEVGQLTELIDSNRQCAEFVSLQWSSSLFDKVVVQRANFTRWRELQISFRLRLRLLAFVASLLTK